MPKTASIRAPETSLVSVPRPPANQQTSAAHNAPLDSDAARPALLQRVTLISGWYLPVIHLVSAVHRGPVYRVFAPPAAAAPEAVDKIV